MVHHFLQGHTPTFAQLRRNRSNSAAKRSLNEGAFGHSCRQPSMEEIGNKTTGPPFLEERAVTLDGSLVITFGKGAIGNS